MKRLLIAAALVLGMATAPYAQVLDLNSPETLAVPTATKLELRAINIDVTGKTILVTYRFLDSTGAPINMSGVRSFDRTWRCRDVPAQLAADCTGVGTPYSGCTGAGTGDNLFPGDTCFTDTFSFSIRTQDAGTPIGKGLRALIWSKMRPAVLTGGNNATLP